MNRARGRGRIGTMLLLCLTLLPGCGSKIIQENVEKIHTGMTQTEVRAILGDPTESRGIAFGPVAGTTSTWRGRGGTITIQFVNDKAIAKVFSGKGS